MMPKADARKTEIAAEAYTRFPEAGQRPSVSAQSPLMLASVAILALLGTMLSNPHRPLPTLAQRAPAASPMADLYMELPNEPVIPRVLSSPAPLLPEPFPIEESAGIRLDSAELGPQAPARKEPEKITEPTPQEKAWLSQPGPQDRPRLKPTPYLASISQVRGIGEDGLRMSQIDNPHFIEGRLASPAEAAKLPLIARKSRSKCAGATRRIPPCSWKVEQRGNACLDDLGVVRTQEGATGVDIPPTINGRQTVYIYEPNAGDCVP